MKGYFSLVLVKTSLAVVLSLVMLLGVTIVRADNEDENSINDIPIEPNGLTTTVEGAETGEDEDDEDLDIPIEPNGLTTTIE